MAEKTETIIIELDFDTSDFTKSAAKLNKEISDLNKEQRELKKSGEEGSIQYQKNTEALRENKAELNETNKVISNLTKANNANAGSNEELKAQLSVLTLEYNKLGAEQRENGERGQELKESINQVTTSLKGNEEAVGNSRRSVGDYEKASKGLEKQLTILQAEFRGLTDEEQANEQIGGALIGKIKDTKTELDETSKGLDEYGDLLGESKGGLSSFGDAMDGTPFGGFIGGFKAMGAAIIANPIGIVIAAIVAGIALLTKAFNRNESNSKKTGKAMAALSGIFNALLIPLELVANFLVDVLIAAFEEMAAVADTAIGLVQSGLDSLGFGDAADSVGEWADGMATASKDAQALSEAQHDLVVSQRDIEIIQLTALKNAELQRQVRDDESASIQERMAANKELGNILQKQSEQELAIANESLRIANEQIRLEGASTDLLDARKEALIGVAEIEERLTGQQSEQLVNVNSLLRDQASARKEAADAAKAALEKEIASQRLQLDIFVESQGVRAKTLDEQLVISENIAKKELEILQKELDEKLISEDEFALAALQIQNELLLQKSEAVIDNAQRELDLLVAGNESKLEENQFFSDALFEQEQERLQKNLDLQLEFEALRLEQGVISQTEYNDAINAINAENEQANADLLAEKEEAEAETLEEDLALQQEIDDLNRESVFEQRQVDLDRQRIQELDAAETSGASTQKINEKYAGYEKALEKDKRKAQVGEALAAFDAVAELAAGNAEAAKAVAIAQAVINGFLGVTAVLSAVSTIPEPTGSIVKGISAAAIGATAIANVVKIKNTPVPKKAAKGGVFGGNLHSEGGNTGYFEDGTVVEVERGELFAVVNRNSTGMLNNLSDLNEAGGGVPFARGGVKSFLADGGVAIDNAGGQIEAGVESADAVIEAIQLLPTPVVTVQDINEVQTDTAEVVDRAVI